MRHGGICKLLTHLIYCLVPPEQQLSFTTTMTIETKVKERNPLQTTDVRYVAYVINVWKEPLKPKPEWQNKWNSIGQQNWPVQLLEFSLVTEALCRRRTRTDSRWPRETARCRGVRPLGSTASMSFLEDQEETNTCEYYANNKTKHDSMWKKKQQLQVLIHVSMISFYNCYDLSIRSSLILFGSKRSF